MLLERTLNKLGNVVFSRKKKEQGFNTQSNMKNWFQVFILHQGWGTKGFSVLIFKVPYQTTLFF